MSPDRWRAISPHLDRALALEEDERVPWLAALREDDPELATDLEALLEERHAADREGFLEDGPPRPQRASLAGQAIGPWTLVSPIGQGGMGSVWLARRSDGRFEGVAAVKLLNAELVGRAGEERFRREGSILARLTHPNIARLLDAGVSATGQPYLVLEHVEGEHVDQYCDERGLDVEARLRLFLDVLAAVAHAHANLVVHRDLKPSNVLVSSGGRVKLLDFGIAKLLEGEGLAGEATALTREAGRALTPEYAAPEQLTGEPITTATDVYALGVLLYVLLGGRHPAGAALRTPAALLQAIVDTEPPRLSTAVAETRTRTPDTDVETAARRATTPERLRRRLRGDLETIVAKALKKRPEERYPSVTALADDLRRYLDHQPIGARPDTLAYRARKFVRRHRVPVTLAALAAIALAGGLAGTVTQARRAARQAALAEEQRDFALRQLSRAEAINDLDAFLLSDAAAGGKPFTARELLARAERIVERQQGESAANQAEMLIAIGRQYWSLDQDERARSLLEKAYALAAADPDRATRAKAACALASALSRAGELGRAESLYAEGLRQLSEQPHLALHRVFCLLRGSEVARYAEQPPAAIERALAARDLLAESGEGSALLALRVAMDLADSYRTAHRHREATEAFAEAAARLAALGRDETETAGTLLNNWALTVRGLGQPLAAERLFRRAVEIGSAAEGEEGVSPMLLNNLALTLLDLGRLPEARELADRTDAEARRAGDELVITYALSIRSRIYQHLGELDRAAALLAELEARVTRTYPPGHVQFAVLASDQAVLAAARGDTDTARAAHDRAIVIARDTPQSPGLLPLLLRRRSAFALEDGRPEDARADAARALEMELAAAEPGAPSSRVGLAHLALARALHAQGKRSEARASFAAALEQLQPSLGPEHPETREAWRLALDGAG